MSDYTECVLLFGDIENWIEPDNGKSDGSEAAKPLKWWQRRLGFKTWAVQARIEPPEGTDLWEYGKRISEILGLPVFDGVKPHHRAVYVAGGTNSLSASDAAESMRRLLAKKLKGTSCRSVAIRSQLP